MANNSIGVAKDENKIIDALIPFVQIAFRPKAGRDLLVFPEFFIDNGVTDLSIFVVRRKLVRRRMHANITASFSTPSKAVIIAPLIRFPALHKDALLRHSGLLSENFESQLKNLLSVGAVQYLKKRDIFFLNPNIKVAIEHTIAIEAKMRDWRTALYQATRYASFAHKSFVALNSEFVHRAIKHIEKFRANQVGLIGVDPENAQCKIILTQTRKQPTSLVSSVIANEKVFARYIVSSSPRKRHC